MMSNQATSNFVYFPPDSKHSFFVAMLDEKYHGHGVIEEWEEGFSKYSRIAEDTGLPVHLLPITNQEFGRLFGIWPNNGHRKPNAKQLMVHSYLERMAEAKDVNTRKYARTLFLNLFPGIDLSINQPGGMQ